MDDILTNTPYDDAFRTMFVECDELVLPLINEVFHTNYRGDEKIVRLGNEHFDHRQGGAEDKKITDGFLEIIGEDIQTYHMECESGTDGSIVVRMFQYGSQIALTNSKIDNGKLYVQFPNAAVMFLRCGVKTPDVMQISINTPGGSVSYNIPVIKIKSYDIKEIFEKRLYFLLPFYIFNFEKDLKKINEDEIRLNDLKNMYIDIQNRIMGKVLNHELMTVSLGVIRDLTNRVAQNLARNQEGVKKGIGDIMGGKVLDLEVLRIRDEGRKEGWDEGRKEGWDKGRKEGWDEGQKEGWDKGRLDSYYELLESGVVSFEIAEKNLGISEEQLRNDMRKKGYDVK